MTTLLITTLGQVLTTFAHNWPFLLLGIAFAAALRVWVDQRTIARFFRRHGSSSVVLATTLAVLTPLCSCGTMAVVIALMAGAVPWAPVVAFMASSPLTSPEELVVSAGLFGWPFAAAFFASAVGVGLAAGFAARRLERIGWLAGQSRLVPAACCPGARTALPTVAPESCCVPPPTRRAATSDWLRETARVSADLLPRFAAFAFLGYFINALVPAALVRTLFGRESLLAVPLAALLGLPLYVNTESSLPLVRAFVDNGASPGAAMAFLVTGAGTSIGAVTGALTIARWRVVGVVVATLLLAAVVAGFAFDALAP